MDIKTEMPFNYCKTCMDCVLKVEEQFVSIDGRYERQMVVKCKNERNCRRLKHEAEKEQNNVRHP